MCEVEFFWEVCVKGRCIVFFSVGRSDHGVLRPTRIADLESFLAVGELLMYRFRSVQSTSHLVQRLES